MDNQQVSTLLEIPNKPGYFCDWVGNIISKKRAKIKFLKPHITYGKSKSPYLRLKVEGKLYLAHRLILSAKIGRELLSDEYVNHKDGNTTNNSIDNLELVSHIENVQHAVENNLYCSGEEWYLARGKTSTTSRKTYTQVGGNGKQVNRQC